VHCINEDFMMTDDDWLALVDSVSTIGHRLITSVQDFDRACDHIEQLLLDSAVVFRRGSAGTTIFLAITALEETAKAHLGLYRSGAPLKRANDPLYHHSKKHQLAAGPSVPLASRLLDTIGNDRVQALILAARSGQLVQMREASLYFESDGQQLRTPEDVVTLSQARELLMFAIEAFDDALVGYSSHSFQIGERLDMLFNELAAA
jgi:AbiV family abortive infection protein